MVTGAKGVADGDDSSAPRTAPLEVLRTAAVHTMCSGSMAFPNGLRHDGSE